jgi:hypothetical protein
MTDKPMTTAEALERFSSAIHPAYATRLGITFENQDLGYEAGQEREKDRAALAHLKALAEENKRLRDAVMRFIYGQLWPLTKEQAEAVDDLRAALKCRSVSPTGETQHQSETRRK